MSTPAGAPSFGRIDKATLSLLTSAQAHALRCMPLRFESGRVVVAIDKGSLLSSSVDGFLYLADRDAVFVEVEPSVLTAALEHYFSDRVEPTVGSAIPEAVTRAWSEREVGLFKVLYFLLNRAVLARATRLTVRPSGELVFEGSPGRGREGALRREDVPPGLHGFLLGLVRGMAGGESRCTLPFTLFGDREFTATIEAGEAEVSISVGTPDRSAERPGDD